MQPYKRSRKKLLLLILPVLVLLLAGGAYATINLSSQKPAQHASLKPGINIDQGQKGLVGWWKLNGNAQDSTPYGDDGTVLGSPAPTATADRKGTAGAAMAFSGTAGYSVANFDNIVLRQGQEGASWSLSIWAKQTATDTASGEVILGKLGYTGGIITGGLGRFGFSVYPSSGSPAIIYTQRDISQQWHLLTATYAARAMHFYVDGQLVGSATGPASMYTYAAALGVGSGGVGSSNFFNGSLSDARVYNRALSAGDIMTLYNSYSSQVNLYSPPGSGDGVNLTAGLIGYWPFNGNAKDATPFQNNGTVSGATLTTDRFGRPNSAYNLNGATDNISLTAAAMPSSAITVAAWVYMPAITPGHSFTRFLNNNWVFASGSWLLYINNTGAAPFAQFGITNPGTTQNNSRCATGSFTTGSWHFLVGTYDGSIVRLYQDGAVCPGTASTSGAVLNTTGTVGIAANAGTGADPYSISQVRIYNRALSAAEVQAMYNLPD